MTRIVHVIPDLLVGGAEMMLYKLLSRLDRGRFDPSVVTMLDGGPLLGRIASLGVPVDVLGLYRHWPSPLRSLRLIGLLRGRRPDLIQGWMYHGNLAAQFGAVFLPARVPVVWTIVGSHYRLADEKPLTNAAIRLCARLSAKPARTIFDSRTSNEMHARMLGFRGERIVVPNGFDTERFAPCANARTGVRASLGVAGDTVLIGLIGRYHPVKKHDTFLRAAALLSHAFPGVHFLLAGRDVEPGNPRIAREVEENGLRGRVHLLGERDDVARITAALDIATSCSSSEGFASVIGEAMSCGVPCVVTDVGDSAWIVGDTGLVIPPADHEALADAWRCLIQAGPAERCRRGFAARERVVREFSLATMVRQYERVYHEIVASWKAPGRRAGSG